MITSQASFEAGADVRPVVDGHGEDDGVADAAVGADHVSAQDTLAGGAELGDRRLGAGVDQVRLDLDAAEAAGAEGVAEQEQLALGLTAVPHRDGL